MLPQGSFHDQALSTTTITESPDLVGGSQSSRSEECTRACPALASLAAPAHADDGTTPLDLGALIRVDTCNYAYGAGEDD